MRRWRQSTLWKAAIMNPANQGHGRPRDEMKTTREFWDASPCGTHGTLQRRLEFLFSIEPWVKTLLDEIASEHPDVVEIGCGQGTHAYYLCNLLPPDGSYRGLGYSIESVAHAASTRAEAKPLNVEPVFEVGDAEELSFPDNSIDFVYSNGVLHHTSNDKRAFSEVARVLGPGGKAIICLYRKPSLKVGVAKLFRGIQKFLDRIFRTDKCLYRFIRGRHFPDHLGTMLLEGVGVPYMEWYSKRELPHLFPRLKLDDAYSVGYNLPHWRPAGSGLTPYGYMWVLKLEKPEK